jgi:hypothetical protein
VLPSKLNFLYIYPLSSFIWDSIFFFTSPTNQVFKIIEIEKNLLWKILKLFYKHLPKNNNTDNNNNFLVFLAPPFHESPRGRGYF